MSFQATSLVARPGITRNPTEGCLLLFLAQHMTADGRRAWPSQDTIAAFMGCSTRTVRRTLAELEARGVIVRGDQGAVKHIPPHRRPVVWDLGPTVRDDQKAPARAHNGRTPAPPTKAMGGHQRPRWADTGVLQSVTDQSFTNGSHLPLRSPARATPPSPKETSTPGTSNRPATPERRLPDNLATSDLGWTTAANPRCVVHAHHAPGGGPPCRACQSVRLELRRRHNAADADRRAEIARRKAAIAACPDCDDHGFVTVGPAEVSRCAHRGHGDHGNHPAPTPHRAEPHTEPVAANRGPVDDPAAIAAAIAAVFGSSDAAEVRTVAEPEPACTG